AWPLRTALGCCAGRRRQAGARTAREALANLERNLPGQSAREREVLHGARRAPGGAPAGSHAGDLRVSDAANPRSPEERGARLRSRRMTPRQRRRSRIYPLVLLVVALLLSGSVSMATAATDITLWTMRTVEAQMANLREDVAEFEKQNP